MDDSRQLAELIDRVVREAQIADPRTRDELRRELESHFADAGRTPEALAAALERFGAPAMVGDEFARAHRHGRVATRLLRLAVALTASAGLVIVLELLANLYFDAHTRHFSIGRGFTRSVLFAATIVVMLAAAWELDIDSLCARLEQHPLRLLGTIGGLAAIMILYHASENSLLYPSMAIAASAVDAVIWACTIAILARTDRASARVFASGDRR
jgi:hypothetical protein